MSRLKIDVIAPPFAGHLHPLLGIAGVLREFGDIRVLTTADAAATVVTGGFEYAPILGGREADVWRIPNTSRPVRGRPWMLLRQFRENLSLLPPLKSDVEAAWKISRPDLVVVDFTLPSVGHWARAQGIRWWTSHPSPLAIETRDGTPTYLGGWTPPTTTAGRLRDALGRGSVRLFKQVLFSVFRSELSRIGLERAYRADGSEMVYSDDVVLALGARELEFPCTWPEAVHFVGPVCHTPANQASEALPLDPRRRNVLVTIGTHLPYARQMVLERLQLWAAAMSDVFFHYTTGGGETGTACEGDNWRAYRYLNYDEVVARFDAVIHHGGAGITYHCLRAAVPAVVWPQDYDQFDFAARLNHHGLAVRCGSAGEIPVALRWVLDDGSMRKRNAAFAQVLRRYNLREALRGLLAKREIVPGGPWTGAFS
jgi:UDP:flavonoid glycosyltransferase YjiC (YdhE family)